MLGARDAVSTYFVPNDAHMTSISALAEFSVSRISKPSRAVRCLSDKTSRSYDSTPHESTAPTDIAMFQRPLGSMWAKSRRWVRLFDNRCTLR